MNPWRRFRGFPKGWQIAAWVIAAIIVIGAINSANPSKAGTKKAPSTPAQAAPSAPKPAPALGPGTAGIFTKDCSAVAGDPQACAQLSVTDVVCRWNGDSVRVTAMFANRLNAHVTVHVQPTYTLANAGTGGDSATSVADVGLNAGETKGGAHDVARPAGVSGSPEIALCNPGLDITGVELG